MSTENNNELPTLYQQFEALGLKAWERKAIEMRADGFTYPEIIAELRKIDAGINKDQTLREYFYHAGKLRAPLDLWRKIKGYEAMSEAKEQLATAVSIAAKTLVALMGVGKTGAVRLGAAREVLDRNLGKPKQQLDLGGEGFSKDAEKLEQIIGILTKDDEPNERDTDSEGDS